MIEIEKGIPIPGVGEIYGRGRSPKYPWGEMKVGDSFVAKSVRGQINRAAVNAGYKHQSKFTVRKIGENEYRVWRIA